MKETIKGFSVANPYSENFRIGLQNMLEKKRWLFHLLVKEKRWISSIVKSTKKWKNMLCFILCKLNQFYVHKNIMRYVRYCPILQMRKLRNGDIK